MKVRLGTAELEYEEAGSGDPVVLVHGGLQTLSSLGRVRDSFSAKYHVVGYTRPHHPGSEDEAMGRPLSPSAAADDLIDLIETLGLAPAHVVGHSCGGAAALLAAGRP